jgi:hypothetical protein
MRLAVSRYNAAKEDEELAESMRKSSIIIGEFLSSHQDE